MEIISYVGFGNDRESRIDDLKNKVSSAVSRRRTGAEVKRSPRFVWKRPFSAHSTSHPAFAAVRPTFVAAHRPQLSLHELFFFCKKHLWIPAAIALCIVVPVTVKNVYVFIENHTGPVAFHTQGVSELDVLDSVMARFAMDGTTDYNDSGDIIDSTGNAEVSAEKLFCKPVTYQTYKVRPGDTISSITKKFGLTNISTLIAVNDISNVAQLASGQKLRVPSVDGLVYTVQRGNSLGGISAKYGVSLEDLLDVNDLSTQVIQSGQQLFIPGAKLDSQRLQQALGTLFIVPIATTYCLSSQFGWRADPFSGVRSYHTGIDMACPQGTPIRAAMSGKVAYVGYSNVFGNYVIINHGNGYQTLYGHMSKTLAARGQWVSQGTRIGLVGTTGYSTGPHLHFTVYKNGQLVNPKSLLRIR